MIDESGEIVDGRKNDMNLTHYGGFMAAQSDTEFREWDSEFAELV